MSPPSQVPYRNLNTLSDIGFPSLLKRSYPHPRKGTPNLYSHTDKRTNTHTSFIHSTNSECLLCTSDCKARGFYTHICAQTHPHSHMWAHTYTYTHRLTQAHTPLSPPDASMIRVVCFLPLGFSLFSDLSKRLIFVIIGIFFILLCMENKIVIERVKSQRSRLRAANGSMSLSASQCRSH